MRRAALVAAALAACSSESKVPLVLPADVNVAVVLKGDDAFVVERGGPALEIPADDEEVVVLFYASVELAAHADGRLVRATGADDPENVWPLPPTNRGAIYAPDQAKFVELTDAARLDALAESIAVPVPGCGFIRMRASRTLDLMVRLSYIESLATVGDVSLMATAASAEEPPRLLLLTGDDLEQELFLDHPPTIDTRLYVFDDVDRFWMVETSTRGTETYAVTLAGAIVRLAHTRARAPEELAGERHWPGTEQMYGRDDFANEVLRFDASTAEWSTVVALSGNVEDPQCEAFRDRQELTLEGPDRGVVTFLGYGPHRFTASGSAVSIGEGSGLPPPCSSAYARFSSGAEMVQHVIGGRSDGSPDVRVAWRNDAASPWAMDTFPRLVNNIITQGERGIGSDTAVSDIALVDYDRRRPDRRPRICHRLGTGDVRKFTLQGTEGRLIQLEEPPKPLYLIRFGLDPF